MNYQERLQEYIGKMADFCRDPGKYRLDPFRIFGPLYYVGDQKVCIHLIDTGDGLVYNGKAQQPAPSSSHSKPPPAFGISIHDMRRAA